MAETTGIAWTRSTFNPWIGCTKVGPGCDHCYAEALDRKRMSKTLGGGTKVVPISHWGAGAKRHRTAASTWRHPLTWDRYAAFEKQTGKVVAGSAWKGKPGFWPVFCASLADVFDNEVPLRWRQDLMDLVADTPNLTWLFLTKRIGMARRMLSGASDHRSFFLTANDDYKPPANLWIGATVVNQEEADRDLPKLLTTPAAKRFVSYEPALGPINFEFFLPNRFEGIAGLDWIIVGGESGDQARPFDITAARQVVAQCREAGAAPFVKQLGSNPIWSHRIGNSPANDTLRFKDRAGANPGEWPEDLRVQEFPSA